MMMSLLLLLPDMIRSMDRSLPLQVERIDANAEDDGEICNDYVIVIFYEA